jgi:polyisoprenyl-phosphate glycosyltransferase
MKNINMSTTEMCVVIPAYNESDVLPQLIQELHFVIGALNISYQIVVVNDGSSDRTEEVLDAISSKDPQVISVNLSRNFGKEAAMAAGLAQAEGNCIVFIDADMQHPTDLIPNLYHAWLEGFDIVNAVKRQRSNESFFYRWMAKQFNKLMSNAVRKDMSGSSDFILIDRQVADALLDCPERNRFFRGLVAWVGFRVKKIEFDVRDRYHGVTKWSVLSLLRYSLSNIVAFSSFPLYIIAYIGFLSVAFGAVLLVHTLVQWALGTAAIGFTTVISIQILLGGMIILALGVISIYLSHMYDEQKQRPLFIIKRTKTSDLRTVGSLNSPECGNELV